MTQQGDILKTYLWEFEQSAEPIPLPEQFPYPFHYEAHPLAQLAGRQLQGYLQKQADLAFDFGLGDDPGQGKMFGVLVVKAPGGRLAFLAAFSGKLGNTSDIPPFVPPFYDRFDEKGWFRQGEEALNAINRQIESLEQDTAYLALVEQYEALTKQRDEEVVKKVQEKQEAKKVRDQRRDESMGKLEEDEIKLLEETLKKESIRIHFELKDFKRSWKQRLATIQEEIKVYEAPIQQLRKQRKHQSAALQQRLFDQYQFLNQAGETRGLSSIFKETVFQVPPSGTGDCAGPKLLQFAFEHNLQPIALAEFWWGAPPKSAIRKHGHFYPACRGKCEPILNHMLSGMEVENNPIQNDFTEVDQLEVIFEDEFLLVINKPAGFLSVPGKSWTDSVYSRVREQYPDATGPMMVHRLDMATSGLLLISKDKDIHKELQHQFIKRTVQKRYAALLDGLLQANEGTIDLPLRVDLDDRPRQLVCYEHGKAARTHWKKVGVENGKTRVHFFPVTGRTHQLRVHAAHPGGLNCSIVGDELYGKPGKRLHLHAEELSFVHPVSGKVMRFVCDAEF